MKLLLHICCGPCSIMPAMLFADEGYELTGFFHNPNIQPLAEYLRRREGASQCATNLKMPILYDDAAWDMPAWLMRQLPVTKSKTRCQNCIATRLEQTALKAAALGIEKFSTSLLYSHYQPHDFIHQKGEEIAASHGLEFIYRDFRSYWQEGIDISKAWEIYRQQYCGCVFSENERYAKKLAQLQKTDFLTNNA